MHFYSCVTISLPDFAYRINLKNAVFFVILSWMAMKHIFTYIASDSVHQHQGTPKHATTEDGLAIEVFYNNSRKHILLKLVMDSYF